MYYILSTDKLLALISWRPLLVGLKGLYARGVVAVRELGEEGVINLRSESKGASEKASKDQSHFTKGRGIDTKDVVGLKEEREWPDSKKGKRPKTARKRKKLLQPVPLQHPALQKAHKIAH